jgi:hypothetical protein
LVKNTEDDNVVRVRNMQNNVRKTANATLAKSGFGFPLNDKHQRGPTIRLRSSDQLEPAD